MTKTYCNSCNRLYVNIKTHQKTKKHLKNLNYCKDRDNKIILDREEINSQLLDLVKEEGVVKMILGYKTEMDKLNQETLENNIKEVNEEIKNMPIMDRNEKGHFYTVEELEQQERDWLRIIRELPKNIGYGHNTISNIRIDFLECSDIGIGYSIEWSKNLLPILKTNVNLDNPWDRRWRLRQELRELVYMTDDCRCGECIQCKKPSMDFWFDFSTS